MSRENVRIVRRVVEAFNSDEPRRAIAGFHPEIEFTSTGNTLDGAAYVGLDGIKQYADGLEAVFEEWHSEDDRMVDARRLPNYSLRANGSVISAPAAQQADDHQEVGDCREDRDQSLAHQALVFSCARSTDRQQREPPEQSSSFPSLAVTSAIVAPVHESWRSADS